MTEYIEREAVLERIDDIWDCADMVFEPNDHCCRADDCASCKWAETKNAIRKIVANFPAADAIEELSRENESLAKSVNEASEILRKRWIPVTERLPEEKTYVLILFDTIAGKMQGVCFLYKDDDGHNCWTWLDRLGKNLFDIQPTHWMPLPEPPKEE